MIRASHLTLILGRFDSLRSAGEIENIEIEGVLFRGVAADTRAAATEPASREAFRFLILGLHDSEASAHHFLDARRALVPWLDEAREVYEAVLQPFRHMGESNYIDQAAPGLMFETMAAQPMPTSPIAIITTVGWNVNTSLDMNRVREFSNGVMGVRMSMTGVDGLHSQQSFFFPRVLEYDPLTVTFWRNSEAARAFAYGPGVHKLLIQRQKEENLADRTSFTRCIILRAEGTWHGNPPHA
jgi:hypothetical protein